MRWARSSSTARRSPCAAEVSAGQVELLTDYQLQIEHALDLVGRQRVVFVDASVRAEAPYDYARVEPLRDDSFSSHALSPAAVLDTHRNVVGEPPPAWVLAIRGEPLRARGGPLARGGGQPRSRAELLRRQKRVRSCAAKNTMNEGRRIEVEGAVQGVGFRPWVHRTAHALRIRGRVINTPRGVTIEAYAERPELDALVLALHERAPAAARVGQVALHGDPALRAPPGSRSARAKRRASGCSACRPISARARPASARWTIRRIATTATRSRAAPSAVRASRSWARCRTTACARRWRRSRSATRASASTRSWAIAASTRRPRRAPRVARGCGWPTARACASTSTTPSALRPSGSRAARSSACRGSAASISRATRRGPTWSTSSDSGSGATRSRSR